ncbi:MAG: hypothetical protein IK096_07985 [Lachnospiraceae bacterium]|nr:hypothetical protein [Lachnospiraceae bacterium]
MAVVVGIIIALIVAAIILAGMKKQMQPVERKHEAAQYTTEQDVKISVKDDTYLRTERHARAIEQKAQQPASGK